MRGYDLNRVERTVCTHVMHGRSRMTKDPRTPTMPGRSTSGLHRPGRHFPAPSAKRHEVLGESHDGGVDF